MSELIEIPLSAVRSDDVGARVVVTRDGNAFDGMLTELWVSRSDYEFKDRPRVTARLEVQTDGSELKLDKLPLDYRIQIERVFTLTITPDVSGFQNGADHDD